MAFGMSAAMLGLRLHRVTHEVARIGSVVLRAQRDAVHVKLDLVAFAGQVALQDRAVLENDAVVLELRLVFEEFDTEEDERADDSRQQAPEIHRELAHLHTGPSHDDGHRRGDQHGGVEAAHRHVQLMNRPVIVRTQAQEDVGGEQAAEEHDLRGQEKPDANLGVPQPGVGPRGHGVGNFHVRKGWSKN